MANPQRENGHVDIANELVEQFAKTNMSSYEARVLWAIFRKTYGWNKKKDVIPVSQLADITGLDKRHVSRAKRSLREKNIITVDSQNRTGIQKNWEKWVPIQARCLNRHSQGAYTGQKGACTDDKRVPIQVDSNTNNTTIKYQRAPLGASTGTVNEALQPLHPGIYDAIIGKWFVKYTETEILKAIETADLANAEFKSMQQVIAKVAYYLRSPLENDNIDKTEDFWKSRGL